MVMTIRDQLRYWGIAAVFVFVLLWLLGDILLPFLVGGGIAYFLDPVADRLERMGLSRTGATAVIGTVAVLVFILMILSIIPTLVSQLTALINAAPDIFNRLHEFFLTRFPDLGDSTSTIRQTLDSIGQMIKAKGGELANGLVSSALGIVSMVLFLVIVPVVAFYLLLDWDKMVARIDALLPRDHAPTIRRLASESNDVLSGFVRGQVTICIIQAVYYSIGLMAVGLQFGLIVGFIAGMITFIPYVGALLGGALAIGLALFQFWGDWVSIAMVVGVFAIGQFVEGNILTPRLMGNAVGLHPVWLLLALSVFGSLFGFVGMVVAVPLAAVLGVLIRFGIEQYQASTLYAGHQAPILPATQRIESPVQKDAGERA